MLPIAGDEVGVEVWRRLLFAMPDMGVRPFGMSAMPQPTALAAYDGVSNVYYSDVLSDAETAMAVLHELGHAYLHPPGSGEFAPQDLDRDEEQLVHNAAAKASDELGLPGYVAAMTSRGAPRQLLAPLAALKQDQVDEIAAFLIAVVRDYEQPPRWPKRG
jgi:hypothetical protein